jgi:hypothetical protein
MRAIMCVEGSLLALLGVLTSFATHDLQEKLNIWWVYPDVVITSG